MEEASFSIGSLVFHKIKLTLANCIARQLGGQCEFKLSGIIKFSKLSAYLTSKLVIHNIGNLQWE